MEFFSHWRRRKERERVDEMNGSQLKSPIYIICEVQASKAQCTPHMNYYIF